MKEKGKVFLTFVSRGLKFLSHLAVPVQISYEGVSCKQKRVWGSRNLSYSRVSHVRNYLLSVRSKPVSYMENKYQGSVPVFLFEELS